jgi:hypothetical protein
MRGSTVKLAFGASMASGAAFVQPELVASAINSHVY